MSSKSCNFCKTLCTQIPVLVSFYGIWFNLIIQYYFKLSYNLIHGRPVKLCAMSNKNSEVCVSNHYLWASLIFYDDLG